VDCPELAQARVVLAGGCIGSATNRRRSSSDTARFSARRAHVTSMRLITDLFHF
jgi:hypothetical protein